MITVICVLLVLVSLVVVIYPLVKPMARESSGDIELSDNLSGEDFRQTFLLELELDYLMGNTSVEIYRELESKYKGHPSIHIDLVE